jgi:hypothetical protein
MDWTLRAIELQLHRSGDEAAWWRRLNIDPVCLQVKHIDSAQKKSRSRGTQSSLPEVLSESLSLSEQPRHPSTAHANPNIIDFGNPQMTTLVQN